MGNHQSKRKRSLTRKDLGMPRQVMPTDHLRPPQQHLDNDSDFEDNPYLRPYQSTPSLQDDDSYEPGPYDHFYTQQAQPNPDQPPAEAITAQADRSGLQRHPTQYPHGPGDANNEDPPKSRYRPVVKDQRDAKVTSKYAIESGFNIDDCIDRLVKVGQSKTYTKQVCLSPAEIFAICDRAKELFLSQPTLIELNPSVKVVGDVHGQYTDLIRLFEMSGYPPKANYLFLGDYVDRGKQSLETILLLLCYKLKYPSNFFLLRGNHETDNVSRVYGFYDECKRRTSTKMWKSFVDVFNTMPIAALIANRIFCVHGGLSPSLRSLDEIRMVERPCDIPDYGLLNDLLWSDPSDTAVEWEENERGVSYCFGRRIVNEFLAKHDLDLVCRAHMVVEDGYEFFNDRTLVTVFSAPNYCGEFDNYGAVMTVNDELLCSFALLQPPGMKPHPSHAPEHQHGQLHHHHDPYPAHHPSDRLPSPSDHDRSRVQSKVFQEKSEPKPRIEKSRVQSKVFHDEFEAERSSYL